MLYRWRVRRRGMSGNHGKVGVKRKWWVLPQPPYFVRKREAVTQGGERHLIKGRRKDCDGGKQKRLLQKKSKMYSEIYTNYAVK